MLQTKEILSLEFYKKTCFTGNISGMRFKIEKKEDEEAGTKELEVCYWPGPYAYNYTDDSLKTRKSFPFETESLNLITEFLNQTYESSKQMYDSARIPRAN